jgi:hypothetical protein
MVQRFTSTVDSDSVDSEMFFLWNLKFHDWGHGKMPYQSSLQFCNSCFPGKHKYVELQVPPPMSWFIVVMEQNTASEAVIQLVKKFHAISGT